MSTEETQASVRHQRRAMFVWGARLIVTAMALAGEISSVTDLTQLETSMRFERAEWFRTYQEAGLPTADIPNLAVVTSVIVEEVGTIVASLVALFLVWLGSARTGALWLGLFVAGVFGGGMDLFEFLGYSSGSPAWIFALVFGWVPVALLGFVTECPSPLRREDLAVARRSAGRLARASGVLRFGRLSAILLHGEAATALWLLSAALAGFLPRLWGLNVATVTVGLLLVQACRLLLARRHVASPDDYGPLLLIRVAILGFVAFSFGYAAEALIRGEGILLFDRFTPLLVNLLEDAAYMTVLLLLSAAVFVKGAVDPTLSISRGVLYASLGLSLVFIFGGVETVFTDVILARIGAPAGAGAWFAGGVVALLAGPMRTAFKGRIDRWLEETVPATELAQAPRHRSVITFSDIAEYSALAADNEDDALTMMTVFHRQARRAAEQSRGRLVKTMGDGALMEFSDSGSAVSAAQELAASFRAACEPLGLPDGRLRTGIHLGEVAKRRDGDLFGDAVNVASRLEGIAEPGQIVLSQAVADQLDGVELKDLGEKSLKNVPDPVRCWAVSA